MRLFTAVELPAAWQEALGEQERHLERAAPGFGRWVDPSLMHVTLVFLGNQPEEQVPTIEGALRETSGTARGFELAPGSLGSFGGPRSLRVVWAGVLDRPSGALERLRDTLADQLSHAGIGFEDTPFRAHITLARARRDATAALSEHMHQALEHRTWHQAPSAFEVTAITLMHSDLRPNGPIYTPLARAPLRS